MCEEEEEEEEEEGGGGGEGGAHGGIEGGGGIMAWGYGEGEGFIEELGCLVGWEGA